MKPHHIQFATDGDYVVYGKKGSPSFSVFLIPGTYFEGFGDFEMEDEA